MLFSESDWSNANEKMQDIQHAVTQITYGSGFDVENVQDALYRELDYIRETAYRAKEVAEDLGLELEKEIIGFK
jgi:conjugal transfer/entry exclusion protein